MSNHTRYQISSNWVLSLFTQNKIINISYLRHFPHENASYLLTANVSTLSRQMMKIWMLWLWSLFKTHQKYQFLLQYEKQFQQKKNCKIWLVCFQMKICIIDVDMMSNWLHRWHIIYISKQLCTWLTYIKAKIKWKEIRQNHHLCISWTGSSITR